MNKPKRQRRQHKKQYPSVKIVSPTGKLRYASAIKREKLKHDAYKDPDASFWADWKPLRKLGVFANGHASSYTHNGITRYM